MNVCYGTVPAQEHFRTFYLSELRTLPVNCHNLRVSSKRLSYLVKSAVRVDLLPHFLLFFGEYPRRVAQRDPLDVGSFDFFALTLLLPRLVQRRLLYGDRLQHQLNMLPM